MSASVDSPVVGVWDCTQCGADVRFGGVRWLSPAIWDELEFVFALDRGDDTGPHPRVEAMDH